MTTLERLLPCPFCGVEMEKIGEGSAAMCRPSKDHEEWCPLYDTDNRLYVHVENWNHRAEARTEPGEKGLRARMMSIASAYPLSCDDASDASVWEARWQTLMDYYGDTRPTPAHPPAGETNGATN